MANPTLPELSAFLSLSFVSHSMESAIAITGCLLLSFLMSGLESAILSLSPARLRHAAKEGHRRAALVDRILGRKDQMMASILVINASANLVAFALVTAEAVEWLGGWGYLAAFVVSVPVYLFWSESLPKAAFKQAPIRLLIIFSPVLALIYVTIRPLLALLALPGRWLGSRFSESEGKATLAPGETREEFRALTEILERKGTLDPREREMILGVLDFQQVCVGEVMLPLSKVTAVPQEMPISSLLVLARQTRFDQFPVMAPNGDLAGIVDVLELLRNSEIDGTVQDYRQELVRCRPGEQAIGVVRRLRRAGHQVAAVHNQRGRPIGIVSVVDMIARLTKATPESTPRARQRA